jgi:hypothetical protein
VLEWIVGVVAKLLGVSPLAAVAVLVAASVGVSAILRWFRSTRQDEYFYLNLTQQMYAVQTSGIAIDPFTLQPTGEPQRPPSLAGAVEAATPRERATRERRGAGAQRVLRRPRTRP